MGAFFVWRILKRHDFKGMRIYFSFYIAPEEQQSRSVRFAMVINQHYGFPRLRQAFC